jgi:cytochrome c oxidase subunit III
MTDHPSHPPEPGGTRREIRHVLPAVEHGPALSWWGAIFAVIAAGMLLASILFAYAFLSLQEGGWPPDGVARPGIGIPAVGTAVLLLSVLPALAVARAGSQGRPSLLQGGAVATAVLGAVQVGLQATTYAELPMAPDEHAYGSVFLLLLILHHLLVASGIVGYLMVALQVWAAPGERLRATARSLALWWCGLVGLWLLVFATLYLSPLVLGGG